MRDTTVRLGRSHCTDVARLIAMMIPLFAVMAGVAGAQQLDDRSQTLIGAGIAIGAGSTSGVIPMYGGDVGCGIFEDGWSMPTYPSAVIRLPRLFGDNGIAFRIGYISQDLTRIGLPLDSQHAVDPRTGTLVNVERELRLESDFGTVSFDLFGTGSLGPLEVSVGPTLGYHTSGDDRASDVITGPDFATFPSGVRERAMIGVTVLTRKKFSFGGVLDISLPLRIASRVFVSPRAEIRVGTASMFEEVTSSLVTLSGGVDILFDIAPSPASPKPVVVVAEPAPVPNPANPTVELRVRSVDSTGAFTNGPADVIYREIVERRHISIVPAVFFDSASSTLPVRVRVFNSENKPADVSGLLAEASEVEAQTQLLNLVGERLRANSKLTVALVGSTSGDEVRPLVQSRVETVRRYLIDTWRIEPAQIVADGGQRSLIMSSEVTREGREENRRVEIVSKDAALLRPVLVEQTKEQAVVPVKLRLDIRSSAPMNHWIARIVDGSQKVLNVDTLRDSLHSIALRPDDITPQTMSIIADASVRMIDGKIVSDTFALPLQWRRERTIIEGQTERSLDRERSTWQLLGFNFDSPDLVDRHRVDMQTISAAIRDNARVVVTGYSDRLGDQKRNFELSRERADRVAAFLREELARRGTNDVAIEAVGMGVDETRFTNDLPEGRMLSRGVTLVVDQIAK